MNNKLKLFLTQAAAKSNLKSGTVYQRKIKALAKLYELKNKCERRLELINELLNPKSSGQPLQLKVQMMQEELQTRTELQKAVQNR